MNKKIDEYAQINKFLSNYSILQHNDQVTVVQGQNNVYLIRNIQISIEKQKTTQLNQIINTLTQHQQFNSKHILSLLDFQIVPKSNKSQTYIRAIYQYGKKNLFKQIQQRKISEQYFQEDALWGLLYSLANSLSYLQQKNVIYGVIDPLRVFLDKGITLLDPSSTGINPYQIIPGRLYSPELLKQQKQVQQLDMFKSDVFVLGLLILQSALLKIELYEYDQNIIQICLTQIQDLYSKQFCQIVSSLLIFDPAQRPSFKEILKNLSDLFEISTSQIQTIQPLHPDKEDQQNLIEQVDQEYQRQWVDILQNQNPIRIEQENNSYLMSDYEMAKQKFCQYASSSRITQQSVDQSLYLSRINKQSIIQNAMMKSSQKSKRVYKAKQIKDRLIKPQQICYHSSSNNLKSQEAQQHQTHTRAKSVHWQDQNSNKNNSQIVTNQSATHRNQYSSKQKINNTKNHCQSLDKQNKPSHNLNNNHNKSQYRDSSSKKSKHQEINLISKENLFTKPEIMNMIKNDIRRIEQRKKNKMNVHFNYCQQNDQLKKAQDKDKNSSFRNSNQPQNSHLQNHTMSQQFHSGQLRSQTLSFHALKSK